jgi:hypothetical protein
MNTEVDKILGEVLLAEKNLSIHSNGIVYKGDYLLWDDIGNIYVGGSKTSINGIPTAENRTILLVNGSLTHSIEISLSSVFRMQKEKNQLFAKIYSLILEKTSERQWIQFIDKLRTGTRFTYEEFDMTQEALYFRKFWGGENKVDTNLIKGCALSQGMFVIFYQEPNKKMKNKNAGGVGGIPNIHILQAYINAISKNN